MNTVEIDEAISRLAEQLFDGQEFQYAFLEAFGNEATTIKRLRSYCMTTAISHNTTKKFVQHGLRSENELF